MTQPTSTLLTDLSPYVYGTTRLGDSKIPFEDRLTVARAAINSGVWFHTSHTYGNALEVLRTVFDEDRQKVPKLIVKLGWTNIDEFQGVVRQNLDPLAIDSIELGQLCLSGPLGEDFANGGPCYEVFSKIRQQGLVKRYVLEVFPWTSWIALKAMQNSYSDGLIDGYIFYLNPLQRFPLNELWDAMIARNAPMIAMRTVSGGPVHRLRDVPGAAWKDYLQHRAVEVAPIFERSGISSWTEFCVRFAHSFPLVRTTVGSTSHLENLNEFLNAAKNIQPLPADIVAEITALQSRWSDEVDAKAELWSM